MKALVFCGLLVAGQAGAECPAIITSTGWADEYVSTQIERRGDVMVFESVAGGDMIVPPQTYRMHAGIILLEESGIDGPIIYTWDQALPGADDLVPGRAFALTGVMSGMEADAPVTLSVTVLRQEEVTVAGCTYPVVKIDLQMIEDGTAYSPKTVWLHVPSLMSLKLGSDGQEPWEDTAVALR